jgi:hypothetical protein
MYTALLNRGGTEGDCHRRNGVALALALAFAFELAPDSPHRFTSNSPIYPSLPNATKLANSGKARNLLEFSIFT